MNDLSDMNNRGLSRLTESAKKSIVEGSELVVKYRYSQFDIIHLFYALISNKASVVHEVLSKVGVDLDKTRDRIQTDFEDNLSKSNITLGGDNVELSSSLKDLLNESFLEAHRLGHVYVGTEHFLLAMFKMSHINFVHDMNLAGIDYNLVKSNVLSTVNYPSILDGSLPRLGSVLGASQFPLDQFDIQSSSFYSNMNEVAEVGGYSNITGRDLEIDRMIHILSRKFKNNPILVGDAGVGKTAIVEGFVNKLVSKKVPSSFSNKKVVSLDVAGILAGARLRGDIEERIANIINDVLEDGDSIIFIDEIHMIVGAGATGGKDSLDIANILKPYLTGSDLSIIGATTADEYSKYFEVDTALARRFQPIFVDELSEESSKEVIYGLIPEFQQYHGVRISKDAVDEAVVLSSKFIRDRYLPDKAIDIIDEASASLKIGRELAMEPELTDLGELLLKARSKKEKYLEVEDYSKAAKYRQEEEVVIQQIADVVEGRVSVKNKFTKTVTKDVVQRIVVESTKIPLAAAKITDKTLKNLDNELQSRVVGQSKVVSDVALSIQKAHLGFNDEKRPLASFLFLGPTGVGKTELAKSLSVSLFGSDRLFLQINMSELMEMHSISKLIGSPPGYVGYQEGGQLTTFVKRNPYSVILFDEIEKAHPDTLNILLQILEEGEISDSQGNRLSLRNTIIILTSNIGAQQVSNDSKLGFDISLDTSDSGQIDLAYDEMKERILEELRSSIRPELLNRIDTIGVFRGLNKEDCRKIARNLINELVIRLLKHGVVFDVAPDVVDMIANEGYSKEYGARNIRRKIQDVVENSFAKFMLENSIFIKKGTLLKISTSLNDNGEVVFSQDN